NALDAVLPLMADRDSEIREQASKVHVETRHPRATEGLVLLLKDTNPRVRFFAALSLGKMAVRRGWQPIVEMIRENADRDLYLRHAGVMALVGIHDRKALN